MSDSTKQKSGGFRRFLATSVLLGVSTVVSFLAVEFLMLGFLLKILPVSAHWQLDDEVRVLAQSSKKALEPEDYIALVGDSYAEGQGDWYSTLDLSTRSDFYSGHVLHSILQRDVISWGASGSGSLRGFAAEPWLRYQALNQSGRFNLDAPTHILAFFYEGNDLNDNIADVSLRYKPWATEKGMPGLEELDAEQFQSFIDESVLQKDELWSRSQSSSFLDKLYLGKFIISMAKDFYHQLQGSGSNTATEQESLEQELSPTNEKSLTQATIDNSIVNLPNGLQSPALELTATEVQQALFIFEQSLQRLKDNFASSQITVVHIPAVLSSYDLASDQVSIQTYHDRESIHAAETVSARSEMLSDQLKAIATKLQVGYLDSRPAVRLAASEKPVHGPTDWKHFNEHGQRAFATFVAESLPSQL